jgi:hypothetical protein
VKQDHERNLGGTIELFPTIEALGGLAVLREHPITSDKMGVISS